MKPKAITHTDIVPHDQLGGGNNKIRKEDDEDLNRHPEIPWFLWCPESTSVRDINITPFHLGKFQHVTKISRAQ